MARRGSSASRARVSTTWPASAPPTHTGTIHPVFGSRYVAAGPQRGDRGHPRWAVLSCKRRFIGSRRAGTVELDVDGAAFEVELGKKRMDVRAGRARKPDAVLRAPLPTFVARAMGRARTGGDVEGDADLVAAFFESLRA